MLNKHTIAKIIHLKCGEWVSAKNDTGYPVMCQCELCAWHAGPHEAHIRSGKDPLVANLFRWVGQ